MSARVVHPARSESPSDTIEDRILEGAARCFTEVGVRKTTVAEIVAAAGITKPTFYRRFTDKADVVEALVQRETADLARRMRLAGQRSDDAAEGLIAAFGTAARWLTRHPFVRKSLELEPELLMPYLNQPDGPVHSASHAVFAELVARGSAAGRFKAVEPAAVAEVCWRLVLSFALSPHSAGGPLSPERVAQLVRVTLLQGIQVQGIQLEGVLA